MTYAVGTGHPPFVLRGASSFEGLATQALLEALHDAGIPLHDIDAAVFGSRYTHPGAGQRVMAALGAPPIPVYNVENACSSGPSAVAIAAALIGSGMARRVVAVGADAASGLGKGGLPLPEDDYAAAAGVTHPAVYAMRTSRYLATYGMTTRDLAQVPVHDRANAVMNERAAFDKPLTVEDVEASTLVADPLTLLHCSANADGAAAVVLSAEPDGSDPVRVSTIVQCCGPLADGPDSATERLAELLWARTSVRPADIDVLEVYDAFSIGAVLAVEELGFCEPGKGLMFLEDQASKGHWVNPSGGVLGRGHPIGATGTAQIVEVIDQLRGRSGARQVDGARIGLVHTLGGTLRIVEAHMASAILIEGVR